MVVSTSVVARRYEDVSAGVPISVDIPVYETSDVRVYYGNASLLALQQTDYTVALAGDFETFTLTPTAALLTKINALIAADATEENFITVRRELDYLTDATPDGVRYTPFTSREFDRNAMRDMQLAEGQARSLRVGEASSPLDPFAPVPDRVLAIGPNGQADLSVSLSGLQDAISMARSLADNITLTFPLDLGLVSDPAISNQYDLGSV